MFKQLHFPVISQRCGDQIETGLSTDLSKFLSVVVGDKRQLLIVFGPPATPTPFLGEIFHCFYPIKQFIKQNNSLVMVL